MEPFSKFSHFIAYFVPGIILTIEILLLTSIFINNNLFLLMIKNANNFTAFYIFMGIIAATILGLFVDEIKHNWIEGKLESKWAESRKFNLEKLGYLDRYALDIGTDLIQLLNDDYFYFFEFHINIALVGSFSAFVTVIFLLRFSVFTLFFSILIGILILILSAFFAYFGYSAYNDYLDAFVDVVNYKRIKKPKNFIKSLKLR